MQKLSLHCLIPHSPHPPYLAFFLSLKDSGSILLQSLSYAVAFPGRALPSLLLGLSPQASYST